jgi:hypothetical protein
MNSPPLAEGASTYPITVCNSMLHGLSSNADYPVLPRKVNPVQRGRTMRMIIDSAIAILDFDDLDDFNPIMTSTTRDVADFIPITEASTTHQPPLQ